MTANLPAVRLAAGWGAEVCALLDELAGVALERRGFQFEAPVYVQDRWVVAICAMHDHCCWLVDEEDS